MALCSMARRRHSFRAKHSSHAEPCVLTVVAADAKSAALPPTRAAEHGVRAWRVQVIAAIFCIGAIVFLTLEIVAAVRSHIAAGWRSTVGRLKHWDIAYDQDAEDTKIVLRN